MFTVTLARKISPLGGLSALLGRNDKVDIIFRDPFDCAEKTGLPKIAAKRDFWEEEEPPCKSSDDELRVTRRGQRHFFLLSS